MGMSQAGCCCATKHGTCITCEPTQYICCLQFEHTGWSANACILVTTTTETFPEATDDCPVNANATEVCGYLVSAWNACGDRNLGGGTPGATLPYVRLSWKPIEGDCSRIMMTLSMGYTASSGPDSTATVTQEVERTWYTREMTFTDPLDEVSTIYIRTCPVDYTTFPPLDEVVLEGVLQRNKFNIVSPSPEECYALNPDCVNDTAPCWPCRYIEWLDEWEDVPLMEESYGLLPYFTNYCQLSGKTRGNCGCGWIENCCNPLAWSIDLYSKEAHLKYETYVTGARWVFESIEPYPDCDWYAGEIFLYPSVSFPDSSHYRVRVQPVDWGEGCEGGGEVPDPPPSYCKRKTLCVLLSVDGGEEYQYYNLVWDAVDARYELVASSVAGGKPYTIEIVLVEVSGPGTGTTRTWELTVIIRDSVTGDIVYEFTDEYVLNCEEPWSLLAELEVPGEDPSWLLTIATQCPDPPDPPPPTCDPGCWPECVMCPTRKTLYAVVSDAPDCCLSGTYALTWVGTGGDGAPTVGYYTLPAWVGGPIGTCGQITFLTVSCVDSTHIQVQLVYFRAEGTWISNLGSPDTLSVICDGSGHLESDAIHVPGRSGDRESLCGFDDTVGGDIRIVSD